jgi:hypothetical protein
MPRSRSDNGTEFINDHLYRYCQAQGIQFTRGRPYKKDDNAHIEQKNWTHVRKLVGYLRYDTPIAVAAPNALYRHELRLFQNLFLPSVKLVRKERVSAGLRRQYDAPRTPLERLQACPAADPMTVASWIALRDQLDPFALSQAIDRKIERLVGLATIPRSRLTPAPPETTAPPTPATAPSSEDALHLRQPPTPPRGPAVTGNIVNGSTIPSPGNILKWLDRGGPHNDQNEGRRPGLVRGRPDCADAHGSRTRGTSVSGDSGASQPGSGLGGRAWGSSALRDPSGRTRHSVRPNFLAS